MRLDRLFADFQKHSYSIGSSFLRAETANDYFKSARIRSNHFCNTEHKKQHIRKTYTHKQTPSYQVGRCFWLSFHNALDNLRHAYPTECDNQKNDRPSMSKLRKRNLHIHPKESRHNIRNRH